MADLIYTKILDLVSNNTFKWSTAANVKVILLNSTHAPNVDHNFISDIVAQEITATNYTGGFGGAGRKSIGGRTIVKNDASDREEWKTSDVSSISTALTMTGGQLIRYAALATEITNDAASPLICLIDFVTNRNPAGVDVVITWDTNGIVHLKGTQV